MKRRFRGVAKVKLGRWYINPVIAIRIFGDLSDLVLPREESPRPWASETKQTPENRGGRSGREGSIGNLFAADERDLTDPTLPPSIL
jgi:hypothetical protein